MVIYSSFHDRTELLTFNQLVKGAPMENKKSSKNSTKSAEQSQPQKTSGAEGRQGQGEPTLTIRGQFIRDLSFENPTPLESFTPSDEQPSTEMNLQRVVHDLGNKNFEVTLDVNIKSVRKDKPIFVVELSYSGVFHVGGDVKDEIIRPLMMIEAPRLLFPFARNIIAGVTQDAGFPPVMIPVVDFAGLYVQQLQQEQQQAQQAKKED